MRPHDVLKANELKQRLFFDAAPSWTYEYQDMPEYTHKYLRPHRTLLVHFKNDEDIDAFCKLVGQEVSPKTKFLWHPKAEIANEANVRVVSSFSKNPKYPVYVISKGRWESRLTSKALEDIGVPYYIVVEPQEYKKYAEVIDPKKILKLPFQNLGLGSIPARNWVWEHSVKAGAERHWILDDNIRSFYRYQDNRKTRFGDGTAFSVIENFVDRYENVALAGMQYHMFVVRKESRIPPYYLNTRIYSCILIKNDLPYKWRGRYNEDTDLSLCALKDGHCTLLFNAFLAEKMATMTMKGGNTDELYVDDGRLKMAEDLVKLHPDVVKIITRWGRKQHYCNYAVFKRNKLVRKDDAVVLSKKELRQEVVEKSASRKLIKGRGSK